MRKRTRARIWAVQALYGSLLSREPLDQTLENFFDRRKVGRANREFTGRLLAALQEHLEQVDSLLAAHLQNWSPSRLALLDKIVLRLAVTELLCFADVPPKVTINEYISLAHMFGTDESPRFVNGVLDAVSRALGRTAGSEPGTAEPADTGDSREG